MTIIHAFGESHTPPFGTRKRSAIPGTSYSPSHLYSHSRQVDGHIVRNQAATFSDPEFLELVLGGAFTQARREIAVHNLIARFGDFSGAVTAPERRLLEVDGVNEQLVCELKILEAAANRFARCRVVGKQILTDWAALLDYCHIAMSHRPIEEFRVFYIDGGFLLIADELQARGTVDHVPVYPREILKRAVELGASTIILVHNHPSGDPTPSYEDIQMTYRIRDASEALGVSLYDHLIIGRSREVSLRKEGYL